MPEQMSEIPATDATRLEKFAQTSAAAKLSGGVHQTAGFFKRKVGAIIENAELKSEGESQEMLGKVYLLVGTVRELRQLASEKAEKIRSNGVRILSKHAGQLLDQANEFLKDVRDSLG